MPSIRAFFSYPVTYCESLELFRQFGSNSRIKSFAETKVKSEIILLYIRPIKSSTVKAS